MGLRSTQQENKALDKQSNILAVAGVDVSEVAKRDLAKLYGEKIEARLVDLATGDFVDGDADNFDTKQAAKDPARSIRLAAADDKASLRQISKQIRYSSPRMPKARSTASSCPSTVRVCGRPCMPSSPLLLMARPSRASPTMTTVKPRVWVARSKSGLAGAVQGQETVRPECMPALRVIKGHAPAGSEHEIDGLSGATLTGNGVQHTFDFWMGPKGFGPFLAKVRAGEINNG